MFSASPCTNGYHDVTDEVAEPEDPTPEVPDPGETTDPEEPGETTDPETPDPGETTEPEEPDTGKNNNGNGNDNGNDGNHKGWYKDGGEPVDANLAAADSEPAEEGTLEASLVLAATGGGNGNNGNQGNGNGNKDKPTGSDIKKTSTVVKQFVVDFSREDYKPLMEQEVNGLTYRYVNSDKARLSVVVQGIENGSSSLLDSRGELHAYYHTDYLGTTDYLTSAVNSKVIAWTSYNEWGEITHNAVLKCGQRELDLVKEYATHDYDAVLDLYYAKARFYDAYNRTFTAQDPILDPSQYDLREYVKEPMALVQYLYVRDNAINAIDILGLESSINWNALMSKYTGGETGSLVDSAFEMTKSSSVLRNEIFHVITQVIVGRKLLQKNPGTNTGIQFEKVIQHGSLKGRVDVLLTKNEVMYPFEIKPKYRTQNGMITGSYFEAASMQLSNYYNILSCYGTNPDRTVEVNDVAAYNRVLGFGVLFDKVIWDTPQYSVRLRIERTNRGLPGYITYQPILTVKNDPSKNRTQMSNLQFSYSYQRNKQAEQQVYNAIDDLIYATTGKHAYQMTAAQAAGYGFAAGTIVVLGSAASAWLGLSAISTAAKAGTFVIELAGGQTVKLTVVKTMETAQEIAKAAGPAVKIIESVFDQAA